MEKYFRGEGEDLSHLFHLEFRARGATSSRETRVTWINVIAREKLGERKIFEIFNESLSHVRARKKLCAIDFNFRIESLLISRDRRLNLIPSFLPSMSRSSDILDTIFRSACCHYRVHPRCAREARSSEGLYTRGTRKGRKERKRKGRGEKTITGRQYVLQDDIELLEIHLSLFLSLSLLPSPSRLNAPFTISFRWKTRPDLKRNNTHAYINLSFQNITNSRYQPSVA